MQSSYQEFAGNWSTLLVTKQTWDCIILLLLNFALNFEFSVDITQKYAHIAAPASQADFKEKIHHSALIFSVSG